MPYWYALLLTPLIYISANDAIISCAVQGYPPTLSEGFDVDDLIWITRMANVISIISGSILRFHVGMELVKWFEWLKDYGWLKFLPVSHTQ
ncbi:hypothetical protein F5887DRAFT_263085 [Amanita rubescens]|nr:hypothetical protein F5887DRAFT_263085 [Amanita rubescens]